MNKDTCKNGHPFTIKNMYSAPKDKLRRECLICRKEYQRIYNATRRAKPYKHNPTYGSWYTMTQRCYNSKFRNFHRYGGRGIKVCDEWRENFKKFVADMGEKPAGTSLDRINNDGNYEPSNCRWATQHIQQRNRSNNRYINYKGKRMIFADAVKEAGLKATTVYGRIGKSGWSMEKALTTPTRPRSKRQGALL